MKYVKKPIIIEAFQFGVDHTPEWFTKEYGLQIVFHGRFPAICEIRTIEGLMKAHEGDMIIKGIEGEIYPCKKDIFDKCYDIVDKEND